MNCYRCANETQDGKYTGTTKPHAIRNSSSDSDSDSDHNSDLNSTRDVDWKPATLKTKFHIANIFLCILFVAIIEILLRLSNKRGGLVFADEHTGYLPSYTLFCFEYLPTIIGVLHGLIWSTFDHDIKRLEPFYQLSVPEGVNAENSLLLDYPYQFPILVLVNAVRKRHWVVFCSGLMAILTAFAVTPMMSAIVTRETVNRTIEFEVSSNVILPMEHQAGNVSAMSAHLAYRYQHLDSPLPAFAMDTFGILPFSPLQKTEKMPIQPGETWITNTTLYQADLHCAPAIVSRPEGPRGNFLFSNGDDCEFTFLSRDSIDNSTNSAIVGRTRDLSVFIDYPYTGLVMDHGEANMTPAKQLFTLSGPLAKCQNNHQMLAIWNKYSGWSDKLLACSGKPLEYDENGNVLPRLEKCQFENTTPEEFAAVFCRPRYYEQAVEVSVDASTRSVLSALTIGTRESFDEGVNSTFFEHLSVYGKHAASSTALNVSRDFGYKDIDPFGAPDLRAVMRKKPQFSAPFNRTRYPGFPISEYLNTAFLYPQSIIAPSVIGAQSPDDMLDPVLLAANLQHTFNLYFSFAVVSELSTLSPSKVLPAQRKFKAQAYVVDPSWARALQSIFIALAVLDAVLTYLLYRRVLNLNSDPGTLADLLASVTASPALLSDFRGSEFIPFKETALILKSNGNRYRLISMGKNGGHRIDKIFERDGNEKPLPHAPTLYENSNASSGKRTSRGPWELSLWLGFTGTLLLLGVIGLFIGLYISGRKYHGLPRLSSSFFIRNIAFSYAPTIISTIIEGFLMTITKFVCLVMPYAEMYKKPSPGNRSITIDYESRPPYFLLFKAIRKSHYLLASLIVGSLLANVLAISFSGIFTSIPLTILQHEAQFRTNLLPVINGTVLGVSATDFIREDTIFYAAMRTPSGDAQKVPWASPTIYFIPFEIDSPEDLPANQISSTADTYGFWTDVVCNPPGPSQINITDATTPLGSSLGPTKKVTVSAGPNCHTATKPPTGRIVSPSQLIQDTVSITARPIDDLISNGNLTKLFLEAGEVYLEVATPFEACAGTFVSSWTSYTVQKANFPHMELSALMALKESTILICKAKHHAARHSVTVDTKGYVLSYEQLDENELDSKDFIIVNNTQIPDTTTTDESLGYAFQQFIYKSLKDSTTPYYPQVDPRPQEWMTFLMQQHLPEGTNMFTNTTATSEALENVYTMVFPLFLSQYSNILFTLANNATTAEQTPGFITITEDRMDISIGMLIVASSILFIFVLIIATTYIMRPGAFMIHLPTTIAATVPLVYASKLGDHIAPVLHLGKRQLSRNLESGNKMYGYGWFVGRDGEKHLGVDLEPVDRNWVA